MATKAVPHGTAIFRDAARRQRVTAREPLIWHPGQSPRFGSRNRVKTRARDNSIAAGTLRGESLAIPDPSQTNISRYGFMGSDMAILNCVNGTRNPPIRLPNDGCRPLGEPAAVLCAGRKPASPARARNSKRGWKQKRRNGAHKVNTIPPATLAGARTAAALKSRAAGGPQDRQSA